ncbi:MAG: DUF58 domain-containing protein [Geminicoccaceae bacterium]|nr:DUF58 domain-containing protein [Geminicoccaceae bacterium]MCB9944628.1 DUF58 domain-containing protein [Geminicoccaceae bacterium]
MPVEIRSSLSRDGLDAIRARSQVYGDRLPGLLVEAERVASTVIQGIHGRRRTGTGETFWQYRPYQPGEPATAIDWRQSARSRHLFVRQQEWEAAQSVWFWVDQSASMRFRSIASTAFKHERALLIALALANLLVRGGEQVAVLGSDHRPSGGRHAVERLAQDLLDAAMRDEPLPPVARLPAHGRLVMLSDWLQAPEEVETSLRNIASLTVTSVLLQIIDPAEMELPFNGRTLFRGLEGDGEALFGSVRDIRQRYLQLFDAHSNRLASLSRKLGWTVLKHRTDRPVLGGLLPVYELMSAAKGH